MKYFAVFALLALCATARIYAQDDDHLTSEGSVVVPGVPASEESRGFLFGKDTCPKQKPYPIELCAECLYDGHCPGSQICRNFICQGAPPSPSPEPVPPAPAPVIDSAWVLSNPQEKCADACVRVYGAGQTCDSAFMSELTDETKFLYVAGLLQLTIDSTDIPPNDCAPGVIGNFGLLAFISGASCLAPCSGAGQDAIQLFCCCSSDPAACPTS